MKREQQHHECKASVEESESEIKKFEKQVEEARNKIAQIDKVINESGSSLSHLRENIRLRKVSKQIEETQAEIDKHDMEEAARAKRTFAEKWKIAKDREDKLQNKVYFH